MRKILLTIAIGGLLLGGMVQASRYTCQDDCLTEAEQATIDCINNRGGGDACVAEGVRVYNACVKFCH